MVRFFTTILITCLTLLGLGACNRSEPGSSASSATAGQTPGVMVFAAASTTDAVTEAARVYESRQGVKVTCSFDASSTLAKQIEAGARADIFLSADEKWMDYLAERKLIEAASRFDLLSNELVVVAPKGHGFTLRMDREFNFASSLPNVRRIAVADPAHVPAGRYAKQSLEHLGWWQAVEPLLIPALDVRAALRLVEQNEADAGIVYSTDAKMSSKVELIAAFPGESHEPIRYPLALTASAHARTFADFLKSDDGRAIFLKHGFTPLGQPVAGR